jgi:hypothetical protein
MYQRLDSLLKVESPLGATARSAMKYLAQHSLPASGYYMSTSPLPRRSERTEYHLVHESGLPYNCASIGNRSGFDGALEINPTTNEVKGFVLAE